MALNGIQPIGSMGTDTPLAVLSDKPQLLYNYFKQLFAQVTNPPIDPIREELITSTTITLGSEGNLLHPRPETVARLRLSTPILKNAELEKLRQLDQPGFKVGDAAHSVQSRRRGKAGLRTGHGQTCARRQIRPLQRAPRFSFCRTRALTAPTPLSRPCWPRPACIIISFALAPAPASAWCWSRGNRGKSTTSVCCWAMACKPSIRIWPTNRLHDMIHEGMLTGITYDDAVKGYIKAVVKGVVKVMAKMGISTIQSYCGAQIFEAVGHGLKPPTAIIAAVVRQDAGDADAAARKPRDVRWRKPAVVAPV